MIVTSASLDALRVGFRAEFQNGLNGYPPQWSRVATLISSSTLSNRYGWLKDFPGLREWIGDRQVKSLSEGDYTVKNRDFEATVAVSRNDIVDDNLGIYGPMMQGLGQSAAEFPDELVFGTLKAGFDEACFDGQNFFDDEHPNGDQEPYSNVQAGAGQPWFLVDTTRPLKPIIYQQRQAPEFVSMTAPTDEAVFSRKEYRYGVDLRANAGYGFPQLAFGSRAPLTEANYEAARKAMTSRINEEGKPINIRPNLIVVGQDNRAAAKRLFDTQLAGGGDTNIYYKDVEILEAAWIR